jgi:hypothetical protein
MHCTPRRRSPRLSVVIAATAGLAMTVAVVANAGPVEAGDRTIVVHPNESIQAAIDRAAPNTTIVVAGGVHAEQLNITTDGLTLVGRSTKLVPPAVADPNECSGIAAPATGGDPPTEAGICIIGHDVSFGSMTDHTPVEDVGLPVRSVRVTGFDIAGFSGPYVAVAGGQDVSVDGNHLTDTDRYGVLSTGSTNTRVTANAITGTPADSYIGVCVDDIASPVVAANDVTGQLIGICVSTTGANVVANRIHDGCMGIYVDPGVGATITLNHIFANNGCDYFSDLEYGRGITLAGAQGTVVRLNVIEGHTAADGRPAIRITDDVGAGHSGTGTVATGNVVTLNRIVHNTLDLVSTATGPNRVALNQCSTSVPVGLCD